MSEVGVHVPGVDPLAEAEALGADCVQIFLSDPQSFRKPKPRPDAEALKASSIPIYVHAPYLINVCSPLPNRRYGGRKILKDTCDAAETIGAAAVIVHAGHAEDDVNEGFGRWARTLEQLKSTKVPIYIENTAGGKNAVARRFDDLARLWEAVQKANTNVPIGFCFDTCHAHAAGEELSDAVERVLKIVGNIDLLHANDSQGEAGSGRDRHASLGKGKIGVDVLKHMIAVAGGPVVIEPHEAWNAAADVVRDDLAFVREALRS
ncbi:MAG TPA: deoxyribonuclease IV [Actinomycetota bacterium]|nr:deoxyribonuclease IV [Actinomycetota bacterium]